MHSTAVDTPAGGRYALAMDSRSETILLDRAREGCEQSFEVLVNENSEKMIRLAWRMVRNRADAEEITQEAFLRLYRSLDTFRGDSRIGTWLYRTVTRLCIDYLRREKIKRKLFFIGRGDDHYDLLDNAASELPLAEDGLIAREDVELLQQAIGRLSARQQAVLTLRHQEQLPLREIAAILGLSEGSVKVHLHRAVQGLRTALADKENRDDA